jgi:hypothetical protein
MVLTRRLYNLEEVRAAFLYSIKNKCLYEAVFWLRELEESYYSGEARRLLLLAWMIWTGPSRFSWLLDWSANGNTPEGRLELCWKLCRCKTKDSSIWWLLWAVSCSKDTSDEHGTLFQMWKNLYVYEDQDFWQTLTDQTEHEDILTIFENLQTDMKSYSLFAKCIGLTILYSWNKVPKSSFEPVSNQQPEDLESKLESWKLDNIRYERLYEIPYYCLFGMTWRGAGGDTTDQLRKLDMTELQKSPYWKKQLKPYLDETGNWLSDEHKEQFWDTYFKWAICDHPDEWSLEDQKKSHGPGATCVNAPLLKWWKNWIINDRLFIYGKIQKNILEVLNTEPGSTGISILDRIIQRYKELNFKSNTVLYKKNIQMMSEKKDFITP